MEKVIPRAEHKWLQNIAGNWTYEFECSMGPDLPPEKSSGPMSASMLGDVWVVMESESKAPQSGETVHSVWTLGFDPQKERVVGSFVCSVMTYFWTYNGKIDFDSNTMTLDAPGPGFGDPSRIVDYQDIIQFIDQDYFVLRSQMKLESGEWVPFMRGDYRRTPKTIN